MTYFVETKVAYQQKASPVQVSDAHPSYHLANARELDAFHPWFSQPRDSKHSQSGCAVRAGAQVQTRMVHAGKHLATEYLYTKGRSWILPKEIQIYFHSLSPHPGPRQEKPLLITSVTYKRCKTTHTFHLSNLSPLFLDYSFSLSLFSSPLLLPPFLFLTLYFSLLTA